MASRWKESEDALLYKYDAETVAKITGRTVDSVLARKKRIEGTYVFHAYYCYQCGKEFFPAVPTEWGYKRDDGRIRYFCSWPCLRDYDKGIPRHGKQRKKEATK